MARIAVLDDYQDVARWMADWDSLPSGTEVVFFHDAVKDIEALVERLRGFEIVVSMRERTRFPARLLERLPELRLIAATGRRQSNIDLQSAARRGILVCTTDSPGGSTVELTWALILALTRRIPQEDSAIRAGHWQTGLGVELRGKTLGLVGLGRIGSGVATVAPAFGVHLIAWTPSLTEERAEPQGVRAVSKDDLFTQADIVSIHVPLNESTRGLVGARELGMMRPTAYLVNTSRGPVVAEADLLQFLRDRRIAGAALDVYDQEPLPGEHPFTKLDNVVLTPHLGYVSEENYRLFYSQCLENIRSYLVGNPANVLNPEAWSRP